MKSTPSTVPVASTNAKFSPTFVAGCGPWFTNATHETFIGMPYTLVRYVDPSVTVIALGRAGSPTIIGGAADAGAAGEPGRKPHDRPRRRSCGSPR